MRLDWLQHSFSSVYRFKLRCLRVKSWVLARLGAGDAYEWSLSEIRSRKRALYARLQAQGGQFVYLDVGAGIGGERTTEKHAARCVRVEPSESLISLARKQSPSRQHVRAIAAQLPFRDCTFDLVQAEYVVHHVDLQEQQDSLREMLRVSTNLVMLQDLYVPAGTVARLLMMIYWRLSDGGAIYRSRRQWEAWFYEAGVTVDAFYGAGLCRSCLFILRQERAAEPAAQ